MNCDNYFIKIRTIGMSVIHYCNF
uniref:Uncharacterized protein n=1 Tax=Amphimedon queenslandica TaxID=400682 RepID=A0A1X7V9B5_AMPQE